MFLISGTSPVMVPVALQSVPVGFCVAPCNVFLDGVLMRCGATNWRTLKRAKDMSDCTNVSWQSLNVFVRAAETPLDRCSARVISVSLKSCSVSVRICDRKTGYGIAHPFERFLFFLILWFLTCCCITGCLRLAQGKVCLCCVVSPRVLCSFFTLRGFQNS